MNPQHNPCKMQWILLQIWSGFKCKFYPFSIKGVNSMVKIHNRNRHAAGFKMCNTGQFLCKKIMQHMNEIFECKSTENLQHFHMGFFFSLKWGNLAFASKWVLPSSLLLPLDQYWRRIGETRWTYFFQTYQLCNFSWNQLFTWGFKSQTHQD